MPARLRAAMGRALPAVKRWAAAPGAPLPLLPAHGRSPQRVGALPLAASAGGMDVEDHRG